MAGKMIVIDGNSLVHRAFYALPLLKNSQGIYTNAVYGFLTMLFKIFDDISPDYITIAFDRKAPTFRHLEYRDYKAGRKKMPDELIPQFALLKDVLETMGISVFELDGYEADDILGTFSKYGDENDIPTYLVTGDRDALQLVSENTHVLITKKGITEMEEYDRKKILERYNLSPQQIIDLKGLMGDSSDNIPGVPGIGEKTAIKLLKEYGTVEEVLAHISELNGKKLKENLSENKELALFSKRLATIMRDVPLKINIDECRYHRPYGDRIWNLFNELEFRSLLGKIENNKDDLNTNAKVPEAFAAHTISTKEDFDNMVAAILEKKDCSFIVESDVIAAIPGEKEYIIPIKMNLLDNGFDYTDVINRLKGILENDSIRKTVHDAKKLITELNQYDIKFKGLDFDTLIAAYLLNPTETGYELRKLVSDFLGVSKEHVGAADLIMLKQEMYSRLIKNELDQLYRDVELPLINVLADMEIEGFTVDVNTLEQLGKDFGIKIDEITAKIHQLSGEEFNINSTKQLGKILFEKLGLPVIKKTKTGFSTDIEVLEQLQSQHEIVDKIIEYRQLMKLKSTYIDGLLHVVDKKNHKVHSNFNQTVTATGRISSTEPNLQNIPVKMEMGREIRKVFTASSTEYLLVDADYSQIELRVLAHIANDSRLIDAFIQNQDIHRRTASEVFNVPMDQVTSSMRNSAKAVNFGIVYGISDFGLAKNLNISRQEASRYIEKYLEKYEGVKRYMEEIVRFAQEHQYVTTLLNRRRYLPELSSRNYNIRSFGERVAMNTPIQGTAADIIKKAMISVHGELIRRKLKAELILQVHDELIVNVHKDDLEEVKALVKNLMESVINLKVPLVADIGVGSSWYEAK